MTEAEVKLEARLRAIEYMVAHVQALCYRITNCGPEVSTPAAEKLLGEIATMAVPGVSAVQSDLLAAEYRDAVKRLLNGVQEMMGGRRID